MIAIFSDTHGTDDHGLEGATLEAAREADVVVHAGDFTTERVLEAFQATCPTLFAVHGNADEPAVRDRLPTERVVAAEGIRIAVRHRHDGGETGLAMFGRSRRADVVVTGHTHRPAVRDAGDVVVLNPGSHAQPRGNRPGFATLESTEDGLEGQLLEPDGTVLESFAFAMEE